MASEPVAVEETDVQRTPRYLPSVRVRHELVLPIEADQVVALMERIEEIKRKVLTGDKDTLWLNDKGVPVPAKTPGSALYICRSGWDKMAVAFNVSVQMDEDPTVAVRIQNLGDPEPGPDGKPLQHFVAMAHCRAVLPNGRFQDAVGTASTKDAFFTKAGYKRADPSDVILKAQTVAMNRAVANLLGGSLSAEEMMGKERTPSGATETGNGESEQHARPIVPGEVRIGTVKEIRRGKKSKSGKPYSLAIIDCEGTEASAFLNHETRHEFISAVEGGPEAFPTPETRAEAALKHRVACTLVQEGKYINVGAWVAWTEDIDQPMPFDDKPSVPAAAVKPEGTSISPAAQAPPLSEAELSRDLETISGGELDREPGADDEQPDPQVEAFELELHRRGIRRDELPEFASATEALQYVKNLLEPDQVRTIRATAGGSDIDSAYMGVPRVELCLAERFMELMQEANRLALKGGKRRGRN